MKKKFNIGDKVKLKGCPFDEQIAEEAMRYADLKDKVMTVTLEMGRATDPIPGCNRCSQAILFLIQTDLIPEWINEAWFKKA